MKATTLRQVRQVHNYLAVFFAPAILFFALTGGLQTLGLHEAHGNAPPVPRWIAVIASLHKHQVTAAPKRRPPAAGDAPNAAPGDAHQGSRPDRAGGWRQREPDRNALTPLKLFVVALAAALFITTALGLVIALTNRSSRRLSLVLTILGLVVPVAMIFA